MKISSKEPIRIRTKISLSNLSQEQRKEHAELKTKLKDKQLPEKERSKIHSQIERLEKLCNHSIYLEKYEGYSKTEEGQISTKKSYEFLNLHIVPELSPIDKGKNKITWELANNIKAQKIIDQQNNEHGFVSRSKRSKTNFLNFIESLAEEELSKTNNRKSNYHQLNSLIHHLRVYAGDKTLVNQVDEGFAKGFMKYLRTAKNGNTKEKPDKTIKTIALNTQHKLFVKFSLVIRKAMRQNLLTSNPLEKIESGDKPKKEAGKREYLTIEELKSMMGTKCRNDLVKQAFLFCCLTGLRYSDIKKTRWIDFTKDNTGETVLRFVQKKTNQPEYLQVSKEAMKWVPERGNAKDTDLVYALPKGDNANTAIERWVKDAGIHKTITFHCSRHTAATLNLSLGIPIETVSKLLGHTKLSTTTIYARIVDDMKRKAVNKQDGIFDKH